MSAMHNVFRWVTAVALSQCSCSTSTEPDYTKHDASCRYPKNVGLAPANAGLLRELVYVAQTRVSAIQAELAAVPGNATLQQDLADAQAELTALRTAARSANAY